MSRAPLFRARLLRLGADDHVLLLVVARYRHRRLVDGSVHGGGCPILCRFCSRKAGAVARTGASIFRTSLDGSVQWSTSDAAGRQFAYWQRRLRKAATFIYRHQQQRRQRAWRAQYPGNELRIPNNVLAPLSDLSHSRGATLFMTCWRPSRRCCCCEADATTFASRLRWPTASNRGRESVIGPFANTAIIHTRIDARSDFSRALGSRARRPSCRHPLPGTAFDILADRLTEEHGLDPESLVQVYFVLQIGFRRPIKLPGVAVQPFGYRKGNRSCRSIALGSP